MNGTVEKRNTLWDLKSSSGLSQYAASPPVRGQNARNIDRHLGQKNGAR